MEPLPFEIPGVSCVERPSMDEFQVLKRAGQPFLMNGCMDDWPLYRELHALSSLKDKIAYLETYAGNNKISFVTLSDGHLYFTDGLNTKGNKLQQRGSFSDFSQRLLSATANHSEIVYMHAESIRRLRGLAERVRVLPYLHNTMVYLNNFWIGSGGQVVDLHYDNYNNYICMVEGEKRLVMAPIDVMHDVYPRALDRAPYGAPTSSVKLLNPDFGKFPRFEKAIKKFCVAVVKPGQVLYIPPYWWHHVESFGLNIMINTWQLAIPAKEFRRIAALRRRALRLFATESEETRQKYRTLYAQEVFGTESYTDVVSAYPVEPSRHAQPAIDSLFVETRKVIRTAPDFLRRAEAVFYDQWMFRSLGDPIENQPGEFDQMMKRLARVRWKNELVRFYLNYRVRNGTLVRSEEGLK